MPHRVCLVVMLAAFASLLAACGTTERETSDRDLRRVEVEAVAAVVEGDREDVAVIDVRSADAFAAGHLPGAIHMPLPELELGDPRLEGVKAVIVYGRSPRDPLAPAGAKKLHAQGLNDVRLFTGGFTAWQREGREIKPSEAR